MALTGRGGSTPLSRTFNSHRCPRRARPVDRDRARGAAKSKGRDRTSATIPRAGVDADRLRPRSGERHRGRPSLRVQILRALDGKTASPSELAAQLDQPSPRLATTSHSWWTSECSSSSIPAPCEAPSSTCVAPGSNCVNAPREPGSGQRVRMTPPLVQPEWQTSRLREASGGRAEQARQQCRQRRTPQAARQRQAMKRRLEARFAREALLVGDHPRGRLDDRGVKRRPGACP